MQIKDQLDQTGELEGKLERMADFSVWGEVAARAMGYNPMEFLHAFSDNQKNQSKDAVNFNALADIAAPFPIEIPQWSIELHEIKPNMLVYDPFMGEGNTAKACVGLGVNYIGTEINPTYIKTANEEISRITPTLEIQEDLTQSNTQSGSLLSYFKNPGEEEI